jgi:hypothetical protein
VDLRSFSQGETTGGGRLKAAAGSHAAVLTSVAIRQMIRDMPKGIIAALLICGWVLLSGLDLIEDFDDLSGSGIISNAASPDSLKSNRNGWGALANNIVESATRLPQEFVEVSSLIAVIFSLDVDFDFRRCFRLHKLYRVFLI